MTRDQFLTEKVGYDKHYPDLTYNFSRWDNFGKLWEWAKEQEWCNDFLRLHGTAKFYGLTLHLLNPDLFADAVAKYLGWEK